MLHALYQALMLALPIWSATILSVWVPAAILASKAISQNLPHSSPVRVLEVSSSGNPSSSMVKWDSCITGNQRAILAPHPRQKCQRGGRVEVRMAQRLRERLCVNSAMTLDYSGKSTCF